MSGWEIAKKSYKEIYQNVSTIFIASIGWFLTAGLVLLANLIAINAILIGHPIGIVPFLLLELIVVGPATAGACYVTNIVVKYGNVSVTDFFKGVKQYFFKSIALNFVFFIVAGILYFDFNFFATSESFWMKISSAIWLYGLVFVSIVCFYAFPLMIELDNLDEDDSIKNIIKYAGLLAVKNISFTIFIYFQVIIYAMLNIGLIITLPTLFMGGICVLANNSTLNLLVKHNVIDDIPGPQSFRN